MSSAPREVRGLSWPSIARLGLVQAAIGAVVVLMTSTLNRVMVVELGLMAALPGGLVGLHFAVQVLRPRMGFGSDRDGRRVTWIIGGMALTCVSGLGAAVATAWMTTAPAAGMTLAVVAFFLLGVGVSAGSTPFLAYMAERVDEHRMAGAAALAWILMIAGIIVTAAVAGSFLDPYSPARLVQVTAGVTAAAFVLTLVGVVGRGGSQPPPSGRCSARCGGILRAGPSPPSSSSRCWRTAPRTSSWSPTPARCSASPRASPPRWRACSTGASCWA